MITGKDLYAVFTAIVPLYVAMILAYGSVRWWKIFTPDQCSGINRFVAIFAVPLLSFRFISSNNPYTMNFRFIAADTLQKIIILVVVGISMKLARYGSLDWVVTIFSLSTLPNTLIVGVPLLGAMYGQSYATLMVQVVVLQCIVWYTLLIFFFEFRGAKMLIADKFRGTSAAAIASFKVDADVVSLDGHEFLQTDAEVGKDGKLHVTVRKSNALRPSALTPTPRRSDLSGAEIYSLNSSMNPTPRHSNFNDSDFHSMMARNSRPSNFEKNSAAPGAHAISSPSRESYPAPNPETATTNTNVRGGEEQSKTASHHDDDDDAKEIDMLVWSSSASPVSERCGPNVLSGTESRRSDHGVNEISVLVVPVADPPQNRRITATAITESTEESGVENFSSSGREENTTTTTTRDEKDAKTDLTSSTVEMHSKETESGDFGAGKQMPPANVVTRLILIMVWRKLIRNPNSYSSLLGVVWSFISFRWDVTMPKIIDKSIAILSDAGLGMAMFSLGLFMALQPKIIACGKSTAAFGMVLRFIAGPAVMAAASFAVGCRGDLLRVAIVQAALPQGIVPFVFAKEYNVHPTILSTSVIFGMLVALPITLIYYFLLEL